MTLLSQLESLAEVDLDNQRVFVRADLDAPVSKDGTILDDHRIRHATATIEALRKAGARIIVGSRFGEFRGGPGTGKEGEKAPSIEPAAARLSELLDVEVLLPDSCTGDAVKRVVTGLRDGQVCVLENLAREEDAGPGAEALARRLMEHCDMFVGDSLRALTLKSATTTILPRLLETRVASQTLLTELNAVMRVRGQLEPPHLVVWGASPLRDSLSSLRAILGDEGKVQLVGVAANTMLRAQGGRLGKSRLDETYLAGARTLAEQLGDKLLVPADLVVADNPRSSDSMVVTAGEVPASQMALDIGPETIRSLESEIRAAGTVIWVGAVGAHQSGSFAAGSRKLTTLLAHAQAFTLVAGDDSVAAARATAPEEASQLDCLAQGGDATLALLNGNKLPGLEALRGTVS